MRIRDGVAPRASRVAALSRFSIMSKESEDITLNEAIMRMKASRRNVIHFSIFTIRNVALCCSWMVRMSASSPRTCRAYFCASLTLEEG